MVVMFSQISFCAKHRCVGTIWQLRKLAAARIRGYAPAQLCRFTDCLANRKIFGSHIRTEQFYFIFVFFVFSFGCHRFSLVFLFSFLFFNTCLHLVTFHSSHRHLPLFSQARHKVGLGYMLRTQPTYKGQFP